MAEITKLSVGQALEKLRGTDPPKARMARLDEKIDTLEQETQRVKAMRRRLERDQRAGQTRRDTQEANATRVTKAKQRIPAIIIIGLVVVVPVLVWMWGRLGLGEFPPSAASIISFMACCQRGRWCRDCV